MKKILVRKAGGVLLEPVIIEKDANQFYPYVTKDENCFADILDFESIEKSDSETIKNISQSINAIIKNYILGKNSGYEFISKLFIAISHAKSREDLLKIIYHFTSKLNRISMSFSQRNSAKFKTFIALQEKFSSYIRDNLDLTLAILIKKIFYVYYKNKVSTLNYRKRDKLESLKTSGETTEAMLDFLDKDSCSSQDGTHLLAISVLEKILEMMFSEDENHLCWQDCENARANICPKVADGSSKCIDQYPIITDGYQTFDIKGRMLSFCVTGCQLYRRQERKKFTEKQIQHLINARNALQMFYYDSDTLEQAVQAAQDEKAKRLKLEKQDAGQPQ